MLSRKRALYKAAIQQLEKELDLEWKKAESEQDKPSTRILGYVRMMLVLDRSQTLELLKGSRAYRDVRELL
jgi:hypothetical protein